MSYIAIIGDVINSKQLKQRGEVQAAIQTALTDINEQFRQEIVSKFSLTLGDEFQGVLRPTTALFQLLDTLVMQLPQVALRFGIGLGEITTAIQLEQSIGADGPAYWYARTAINTVHQFNHYDTVNMRIESASEVLNAQLNGALALCEFIKSGWIASQQLTFHQLLQNQIYDEQFEQLAIASQLGLSSSAFAKRLKSSGIKLYLHEKRVLANQIVAFLAELEEKPHD